MNEERIKEVFSDEAFVKELLSKETPEEVQDMLVDKDIDMTIEEIVKLGEIIAQKLKNAENGEDFELSEDDLEDVAGGVVISVSALAVMTAAFVFGSIVYGGISTRGRW